MNREFLINIILLIFINLLVKPLYLFGVDARIQNLVGTEDFGLYFALFNFVFLFQVVNDPGIQNYNSRLIAQDPEKISYHFPRVLGSKIMLSTFFALSVLLFAIAFGYTISDLKIIFLIVINFFLSTLFIYFRTNISAVGMYRKDSFISALDKLIMLVILGYLAWFYSGRNEFSIYWLVYGQMIAYAISCVVGLIIIWPKITARWVVFSWQYMIQLVKDSLPYAVGILLVAIYLRIDGVMLERLLDDNGLQAGIYAAAYRFFEAAGMVAYLFGALLLPMYTSVIKDTKAIQSLSTTGLRLILLISIIAVISLIVYRDDVMNFIYTDATPYYGKLLIYMMLAYFAVAISYIYGALMMSNGSMLGLNIIFAIGVVVNVLLNFFLIAPLGAEGAAIATVITQYLVTIGQIYLAHSQLELHIDYSLVLKSIVFGLLCTLVMNGLHMWHVPWIISMVIGILICVIVSLLMGVVDKSMLSLLRKNRSLTE